MQVIINKISRFLAEAEARVDRQEQATKELQQEIKTLNSAMERLMSELHHGQERARYEREKFQLRIENELLKSGRQLPPKPADSEK